eukprot:6501541-Karenia_brevis.AAC.1
MAAVPEDPEAALLELWKAELEVSREQAFIQMAVADVDSSNISDIGSATSQLQKVHEADSRRDVTL